MQRASWLDRLALRQIESMRLDLTTAVQAPHADAAPADARLISWEMYIEFPYFQHPVVFEEAVYPTSDMTEVPIPTNSSSVEQVPIVYALLPAVRFTTL